ncbi:MAG: MFS transporter, partial [Endozoicomonas sp.]
YNKQDSARMLSAIGILVLMAPLAAPAVGSLLLNLFGWRSIFWLLVTYSITLLMVLFFLLPETHTSPKERFNPPKVVRNYLQVLNHRRALCFIFTQSFSSGMQFSFLTASAFIYMEYFRISSELYPLLFAANILSMMVFNRVNYQLLNRWQPELILKTGITLQLAANGALLVFSLSNPQLTGFMLLVMLAIGTQSMIWPNASACALSYFPRNSGSATALTGSLRFLMGASTGSLISLLHDGTLMTITIMMFCCSGCSMLAYRLAMAIPAPEMPREAKGL